MNKILLFLLPFGLFLHTVKLQAQVETQTRIEISELLSLQQESWNNGDLHSFMNYYWQSDSLLFIGGNGPQRGWQTTLERYQKAYPDQKSMGILTFKTIEFRQIDLDHALLSGSWHLKREEGDLSGYFTLIWKRLELGWRIIYDHSSLSRE